MSETIEGGVWNCGLVDLMTHTSVSPIGKRYPPAHWNPDPMFGLRTKYDWIVGEWRAGIGTNGGRFSYWEEGKCIKHAYLVRP